MPQLGVPELMIVVVIVILLFGPGRIGKIAGELGSGIRSFRDGLQGEEEPQKKAREEDALEIDQPPQE